MESGTMTSATARKTMPFHDALKASPFALARDINDVANRHYFGKCNLLADFIRFGIRDSKFLNMIE